MELAQLFRVDRRRRPSHEIDGICRLRECDHLADGRLAGQNRHDAVEAERDAAMGWRPVLQRLEEEAEPQLRLLAGDAEALKDARLQGGAMDTHAAAADFGPVEHEVV